MTRYCLAAVLLTTVSATSYSAGSAEPAAPRPASLARDSVCASLPAVQDSVHLVVVARARPADTALHLLAPFLDYLAEGVRQHFVPPNALPLPLMGDKGPPTDIAVGRRSINPTLEASLAQAIRSITRDDYLPPPDGVHNLRIHITLYTTSTPMPDQQGFFTVLLPVYTLEKEVVRDYLARPEYPPVAQRNGVEDTVKVTFVVDEHGKMMPETEQITAGRYREFAEAVVESIRRSRFRPALANGCPVKSLVQAPFIFGIKH